VDGVGSRSLLLFYRTDEGELDALVMLLNDEVGIKDIYAIWGNAAGMEDELGGEGGVAYVPCSLELGREFVADSLALHATLGRPPSGLYLLLRHLLGNEALEPRPRRPKLGSLMLEAVVRTPQMAAGSENLAGHPIYGGLWFSSDEAFAFVRSRQHLWRKNRPPPESLVHEFITTVAVKERDKLCRRLAANLEVQVLAGRAKEPLNRLAACTWLSLTEGVVPFEQVPYVKGLGARALEVIRYNLSLGFQSQAEANKALDALSDMFEDGPEDSAPF
jgi:hypothetical protein